MDLLLYDVDEDAMGESDVAFRLSNGVMWVSVWVYVIVDCVVIMLFWCVLDDI